MRFTNSAGQPITAAQAAFALTVYTAGMALMATAAYWAAFFILGL